MLSVSEIKDDLGVIVLAGQDDTAQEQATRPHERPTWLAVGLTASGFIVLLVAWLAEGSYWESVLVNIGTTFILFATLAFLEPRLVRRLKAHLAADGLSQAQAEVMRLLSQASGEKPSVTRMQATEDSVRSVGRAIVGAGLVQCRAEVEDGVVAFEDTKGLGLRWCVGVGPHLSHKLCKNGLSLFEWPPTGRAVFVKQDENELTDSDRESLAQFENEVVTILRGVAIHVGGQEGVKHQ